MERFSQLARVWPNKQTARVKMQVNKFSPGREFGENRRPLAPEALSQAIGELAVRASVISAAHDFPMPRAVEKLQQDYLDLVLLTYKRSLPTRAADRKRLAKTGELMQSMVETATTRPTA